MVAPPPVCCPYPVSEDPNALVATPSPGPSTGTIDHELFSRILARFAGTLDGTFTLDDVMAQLGTDVRQVLGVAGAGAMTRDSEGRLRLVTSSDGLLEGLEALQVELEEGPALLAFRTGSEVYAQDLATDERFPRFGPRAVAVGLAAVHSWPMRLDGTTVGALNLYSWEPGALTEPQLSAARTFAHVATAYLVHAHDLEQRDLFTRDLQKALTSRVVVEQAKGYVAARTGISTTEAFDLIRGRARGARIKVHDLAEAIVAGEVVVEVPDGSMTRTEP